MINEIRSTALWNRNTTNYRTHLITHNHKNTYQRGANVVPRTTRNSLQQVVEWSQTNVGSQQQQNNSHTPNVPDPYQDGKEIPIRTARKADDTNSYITNDNPVKSKRNRRSRSQQRKRSSAIDRTKS